MSAINKFIRKTRIRKSFKLSSLQFKQLMINGIPENKMLQGLELLSVEMDEEHKKSPYLYIMCTSFFDGDSSEWRRINTITGFVNWYSANYAKFERLRRIDLMLNKARKK